MSERIKIVPALCTQCGASVDVDPDQEKATCPFCRTSFVVEKAIENYTIQQARIDHVDNVNIDVSGSVRTVLDFVGEQMKGVRIKDWRIVNADKSEIVDELSDYDFE